MATVATRTERKQNLANENKNRRTDLTPTGLLMEGFITLYKSLTAFTLNRIPF